MWKKINKFKILSVEAETNRNNIPARHWHFIFTCFEPLDNVTGGIGKYIKLLLPTIASEDFNTLILTRRINENFCFPKHIHPIFVEDHSLSRPISFVGDEHDHFSFNCHLVFRNLSQSGHKFGVVEFSDYGVDGYYPLQAAKTGVYSFRKSIVRLHSPDMMLIEDNGGSHTRLSTFQRERIDREISIYENADIIAYGGGAMRDRVNSLISRYSTVDEDKFQQCYHPVDISLFNACNDAQHSKILSEKTFAPDDETTVITLSGRIEHRKGQVSFFNNCLDHPPFAKFIKENKINFVFCGKNVMTSGIAVAKFDLLSKKIGDLSLESNFVFLGKLNTDDLYDVLIHSHGYIFPSIFENYPNALLETLPFSRPTLISSHGCMPEIMDGLGDSFTFDPSSKDMGVVMSFLEAAVQRRGYSNDAERAKRLDIFSQRQLVIRDWYLGLLDQQNTKDQCDGSQAAPTIGFVIPIHQNHAFLSETLSSCIASMGENDTIIVVDDGSEVENAKIIESICMNFKVDYLRLNNNSGPLMARIAGARTVKTDLIQFCDSDDILEPAGVQSCRSAFERTEHLDAICGAMACFGAEHHIWVPRNGFIWTGIYDNFSHSGAMFKREKLLETFDVENIDVNVNEDWLANLMFIARGNSFKMTPEITYHYRRFPQSRSSLNAFHQQATQKVIIQRTWQALKFSDKKLSSRVQMMTELFENDTNDELRAARHRPDRLLSDLVLFNLLTMASKLSGILPARRIAKFKKSAAKRDPDR